MDKDEDSKLTRVKLARILTGSSDKQWTLWRTGVAGENRGRFLRSGRRNRAAPPSPLLHRAESTVRDAHEDHDGTGAVRYRYPPIDVPGPGERLFRLAERRSGQDGRSVVQEANDVPGAPDRQFPGILQHETAVRRRLPRPAAEPVDVERGRSKEVGRASGTAHQSVEEPHRSTGHDAEYILGIPSTPCSTSA